jgi:hypothetical protein
VVRPVANAYSNIVKDSRAFRGGPIIASGLAQGAVREAQRVYAGVADEYCFVRDTFSRAVANKSCEPKLELLEQDLPG